MDEDYDLNFLHEIESIFNINTLNIVREIEVKRDLLF